MSRRPTTCLFVWAGLFTVPLLPPVCSAGKSIISSSLEPRVQIVDLDVFTHRTKVPASFDPASLRFERVRAATVPTKMKYTFDPAYCDDPLPTPEPGGSLYCPFPEVEVSESASAYEVTYSYTGPPMASDELANQSFSLQVYFRVDELPPALRQAISAGKMKRSEEAAYFRASTSRETWRQVVVDGANSSHCAVQLDRSGHQVKVDRNCVENVVYKTDTVPSDYALIQIDFK